MDCLQSPKKDSGAKIKNVETHQRQHDCHLLMLTKQLRYSNNNNNNNNSSKQQQQQQQTNVA